MLILLKVFHAENHSLLLTFCKFLEPCIFPTFLIVCPAFYRTALPGCVLIILDDAAVTLEEILPDKVLALGGTRYIKIVFPVIYGFGVGAGIASLPLNGTLLSVLQVTLTSTPKGKLHLEKAVMNSYVPHNMH